MNKAIKIFFALIFIIIFCILNVCAKLTESELAIIESVKKVKPAVVSISFENEEKGSGIVISPDGYIVTNAHVIKGLQEVAIELSDGRKFQADVLKIKSQFDLAIVRIKNVVKLTVPVFGNSDKLQLGQTAIAIGNPMNFGWTVTVGAVSALGRDIKYKDIIYQNLIQMDAAINPGNSGGALVNTSGEIIGINTLVYSGVAKYSKRAEGLSFAIPSNTVLKVVKEMIGNKISGKIPKRIWLGINIRQVDPSSNLSVNYGILITKVTDNSPAKKADIRQGDIITQINNSEVRNIEEFKKAVSDLTAGSDAYIVYWRGTKKYTSRIKAELKNE